MQWTEIRRLYPKQWLVLEVLKSHQERDHAVMDDMAIVEACPDSSAAFRSYQRLRKNHHGREFIFMHTDREDLALDILPWVGIRRAHATHSEG